MALKIDLNYSPNFYSIKRNPKQIKFLIFHYTGMKKESDAIKKLTSIKSDVSSHYFIKNNGDIILMVPDLYIAWHAGKSSWKNYTSLNKNSIGIEISNPGHRNNYINFSKQQIKSLVKLSKYLIHKYKIKKNCLLGHSDIAPDRKLDPGEKFPWKMLSKKGIGIWHNLNLIKLKSFRYKFVSNKESNLFVGKLKIFGYSNKSNIFHNSSKFNKLLVKAFQRRFRPELINGKIDHECLLILDNLLNIK